ncbi:hypothetical protein ACTFIW_001207 [Dictyostelium discoideum]
METNPIILLKDKINLIKKNIENENDPSKLNDLKLKLNSWTDQLIFWEKLVSEYNLEQSKQLKKLESDSLEKLKKLESDKLDFQIFLEHQPRVSYLIKNGGPEVSFVQHTTSEKDSKHEECTTIEGSFTLFWNDDRMLNLVKESCKIFSQKGYFHKDLSKRHVAKYTESDKIKIVFIDLSRVDKISVDRSEEMYSCIINDRFKQPTVFSIFDNINLRSSNTKNKNN